MLLPHSNNTTQLCWLTEFIIPRSLNAPLFFAPGYIAIRFRSNIITSVYNLIAERCTPLHMLYRYVCARILDLNRIAGVEEGGASKEWGTVKSVSQDNCAFLRWGNNTGKRRRRRGSGRRRRVLALWPDGNSKHAPLDSLYC